MLGKEEKVGKVDMVVPVDVGAVEIRPSLWAKQIERHGICGSGGHGYADNFERFLFSQKAAHLRREQSQAPPPDYFRFDVVEVIGEPDMEPPKIRHIENAFQLGSAYKLWW